MKNYKDETIKKLCEMLNYLDDNGCLVDEDKTEYQKIVTDYSDKYEAELVEESRAPFCRSCSNCYILRSNEDGEIIVKTYDNHMGHAMMRDVSKRICFSDCDDTYDVIKIIYRGRDVHYTGWQPGMVMEYKFTDTGDEAWSGCFPEYDH